MAKTNMNRGTVRRFSDLTAINTSGAGVVRCSMLAIFMVFIIELFTFGSGLHFSYGGVTPRKFLFVSFSLFALLNFVKRGAVQVKLFYFLGIWLCYFFFWVVLLWGDSGRPLSYGIRDAFPLIGVAAFYYSWQVVCHVKFWSSIKKLLVRVIFAYAVLHIAIFFAGLYSFELALSIGDELKTFMEPAGYAQETSVFIVPMIAVVRVYFVGSCMLLLGLYLGVSYFKKRLFSRVVYIATMLLAILSTMTRSFMVATVFYFLGNYVFRFLFRRSKPTFPMLSLLVVIPLLCSFLMLFSINPDFLGVVGLTRDGSDGARYDQLDPLLDALFHSPIVGHGFGLSVEPIRNEDGPYSYELSIVALFAKVGILGVLVASLSIAATLKFFGGGRKFQSGLESLYSLYFCFIIATFFNPYLFSFYGTLFLLFLLYEYVYLSSADSVCSD